MRSHPGNLLERAAAAAVAPSVQADRVRIDLVAQSGGSRDADAAGEK